MQPRTLALTLVTFALGACSSSGGEDDIADAKLAARVQLEGAMRDDQANVASDTPVTIAAPTTGSTRPAVDICKQRAWYGDGECDAWCPQGDPKDCAPSAGGVACAAFFSPADGFCNAKDPCGLLQDEDCMKQTDPSGPGCAPDQPTPVPGDGKCEPKSLAEFKADPDCANVVCPAIFSPADGVCKAQSACDFVIDEDCARSQGGGNSGSGGIACDAIAYPANGKCEAPPGCEANDPKDCHPPVACIDIAYAANGKCEAAPGCEANDPKDCHAPVACIDIAYATNGKCEAAPGCEASDPKDCKEPVACILILYSQNGKCEAAPGCEGSDPDC